MPSLIRLCSASLLSLALTACMYAVDAAAVSKTTGSPDPDAVRLVAMGEQAKQLALKEAPNVVLLQVFTDLAKTSFSFMDNTATIEVDVLVPAPDAPLDQWVVRVGPVAKPEPGINLQSLRIGPIHVAQAIVSQWPDCGGVGLTLYGKGNDLTWSAYCNVSEGVVNGLMDNQTGVFQPGAGPAQPPSTANP
jgi:hypothetical protein